MGSAGNVTDATADWVDRLYDAARLPPYAVGLAVALGLFAFFGALALLTGELQPALRTGIFRERNVRIGITLTLLVAYLPTAQRYLVLATRRNLDAVRGMTRGGAERPAAASRPHRRFRIPWVVALVPAVALIIDRDPSLYFRPGYWGAGTFWSWSTGLLFAWSIDRFSRATFAGARQLSAAAKTLGRVDLFDRRWLSPFAQQGLLCALLWLAIPALFAFNLGDAPVILAFIPLTLLCTATGLAAMLLPSLGVRRRLQAAKQAELARVHRALGGDERALADSQIAARHSEPSLADLLAYEQFLRQIPVWPFDQTTWLRFGLYLALPLGSWLGGAVVERLLGAALD
jgi:hypothetical protein